MRLRLVEIEGTPEEIARLDIEQLLGHPLSQSASVVSGASVSGTSVSGAAIGVGAQTEADQLERIIQREAPPGRAAGLLREFLETVISWGDVSVVPSWRAGDSRRVSYLRVHRHPRTRGAFVYVFPGRLRLNFRLESQVTRGLSHAVPRGVKADNAYQVSMMLSEESALAEAIELGRLAYEAVGSP